ncbi:MAG: 30S ribosomal protein S6 [Terriglobia bacterium]
MRTYEVIFILRPEEAESEIDALIERMQEAVAGAGGQVGKTEKWGKRTLAYRVAGQREGFYVFFELQGSGETVRELERRLRVSDPVIKLLSVRTDLERKRVEKLRHRREHKAARRQRTSAGGPAKASASA